MNAFSFVTSDSASGPLLPPFRTRRRRSRVSIAAARERGSGGGGGGNGANREACFVYLSSDRARTYKHNARSSSISLCGVDVGLGSRYDRHALFKDSYHGGGGAGGDGDGGGDARLYCTSLAAETEVEVG